MKFYIALCTIIALVALTGVYFYTIAPQTLDKEEYQQTLDTLFNIKNYSLNNSEYIIEQYMILDISKNKTSKKSITVSLSNSSDTIVYHYSKFITLRKGFNLCDNCYVGYELHNTQNILFRIYKPNTNGTKTLYYDFILLNLDSYNNMMHILI